MTSLAGANGHLHHNVHMDDSMMQAADDWECQIHGVVKTGSRCSVTGNCRMFVLLCCAKTA